jgi:ssDNA-binding Zn-finger/Zn-ribbon topoisomerase 1
MQEENGKTGTGTKTILKVCPKCEGPLVERRSKYGPFLGCGTYPKCAYIERT